MHPAPSSAVRQSPVFFPAGPELLFGVLTRPADGAGGLTAVLLSGAGVPATNHNRFWVRLSRELAGYGVGTFRIDYHGLGESGGRFERVCLEQPPTADLVAATTWLAGQGLGRIAVIGVCLGAATALATAPELDGLAAVALLTPALAEPSAAAERHRQAAQRIRRQLACLAERAIPTLVVLGTDDPGCRTFEELVIGGSEPDAIAAGLRFETVSGELHGLPTLRVQDLLSNLLVAWLTTAPREKEHNGL